MSFTRRNVERMIRFLVLGAGSYIGTSFQTYLQENYGAQSQCDVVSLHGDAWKKMDWSGYDCILNVTGKAHADIGSVTDEEKAAYYQVNCELAAESAKKALADGAAQYIYLSSIIVYGDSSDSTGSVCITKETEPSPSNFYGDSKWRAEQRLAELCPQWQREKTALVVVRLPMIYGKNCRGNYRMLEKLADKLPVFPDYRNRRSMLYIENLCEFLWLLAKRRDKGLFFPQNEAYVATADMIAMIGREKGKRVHLTKFLNPVVALGARLPGKIGGMVRKAFGSLTYELGMSAYDGGNYRRYSMEESIRRIEK